MKEAHSNSAIDNAVIEDLRQLGGEDDPELLNELIHDFLTDAPTYLAELQAGLENGNLDAVARAAHTLKSSSAYLGAVGLSGICREIEESTLGSASDGVRDGVTRSLEEFERVRIELERLAN